MSKWPRYVCRVRCKALRIYLQMLESGTLDDAIHLVDEQIDGFLPALQAMAPGQPWSGLVFETHGKFDEREWTVAYSRRSEDP